MIPKKIFLCYNVSPFKSNKETDQELKTDIGSDNIERTKKYFPSRYRIVIESIKTLLSDWELVFYDKEAMDNFVKEHFPDYFIFYDKLLYDEQKYNLMKYMFLYINGGVSIDLNLQVLQSLDSLFNNIENVSLYTIHHNIFHNYLSTSFIAAVPKCPIFTKILETAKNPLPGWVYGKFLYVEVSTGYYMLTKIIKSSNIPYVVFPTDLVLPCGTCQKRCYNYYSYFKLLQKINPCYEEELYKFIYCNWKECGLFLMILLIMAVFIKLFIGRKHKNRKS